MSAPTRRCVVKNMADGMIVIRDGTTPIPNSLTIVVDEGDLSFAVAQRESVQVMDRTDLGALRRGKAKPCSGRFQAKYTEWISSGTSYSVTPHEALFGAGAASGWKSTNDDGGDVRTVAIEFHCASPIAGEAEEVITFAKCFDLNEAFSERLDADTLAISFKDFEERPTVAKGAAATEAPTSGA